MIKGRIVQKLRNRKGLTLLQLAAKCGISESHMSRIERKERDCSLTVLKRLARALDTTVEAIL